MMFFVIGGLVTWCLALSFLTVGLAAQRREQELEIDELRDADERRAREINELYQANALVNNRVTELESEALDISELLVSFGMSLSELQELHADWELGHAEGHGPKDDGWLN